MKKSNKTFKRVVSLGLIVGLLASIGIGAYLTSTDVKQDVYTVGNVQAEIVANGDMELDNVGALLPGTVHQYKRAAMNTGINDAYVFMSLTIPYEMVGVSEEDGTQIGERTRQLFIPGVQDGYIGSEWKLVDVGYIGQYEIEDNGQYCGEHDAYSAVVGDTITYVYGYVGDNTDGSLKALKSGETTSNLVETMELTNLYHIDKIDGEVSTKLYAIQSNYVNGGMTDVNGVWAVINKAISGEVQEASTLSYSIRNTNTGDAVGYAPLKLVDGKGNVIATSVANENGNGQFANVPAGDYAIQTAVGDLVLTGGSTGYGLRNKTAAVTITGEDSSVALGLELPVNTLVQGQIFNTYIPSNVSRVEFVAMPQTYGLTDRTVPADAIDVSEAVDGSVMAWVEGDTFYVVAMDGGIIYANPNSDLMFKNKSNLTYIDTANLSTTGVYTGKFIFSGCTNLTNNIEDFDVSNIRGLEGSFSNCSWITEYVIPEGTIKVAGEAFSGCSNLISIEIPSSVKHIAYHAFSFCSSLTSVVIPEGVERIDYYAFAWNTNLVEITIPSTVNNIDFSSGSTPFTYCDKLTNINVNSANENYTSVDGVLFTKDMKTLIIHPAGKTGSYIVPEGVETINVRAFVNCTNLTSVILPNGLKEISDQAFQNCSNLTTIEIPTTATTIGSMAFAGTKWLDNQKAIGEIVIVNGVWIDASAATGDFAIPEGTTSIPDALFRNNNKITSVCIPASVKEIGQYAFYNCSQLASVTFAEGSQLKTIGFNAFANTAITSIELPDSVTSVLDPFAYCDNLTSINIPTSMTRLGPLFANTNITSVVIPNHITDATQSFSNCSNLVEIIVADDHPTLTVVDNVLFSKDMKKLIAYPAGKTDTTYVIPDNVTNTQAYCFSQNKNIEEIVIPASFKSFSMYSLMNCSNLKTISFCGTQAQWNQVSFNTLWNSGVHSNFKVVYDCVHPNPASHTCESICPTCKLCLDMKCAEAACANKCAGHVSSHKCESVCPVCNGCLDKACVETVCSAKCKCQSATTYRVTFQITDNNEWKETPTSYTINVGDKKYSVELTPGKTAYVNVPNGTYDVVVYANFADGTSAETQQNVTNITVKGSTTQKIILGEVKNYNLTLNITDTMNWGDKAIDHYQVKIDGGASSIDVAIGEKPVINIVEGTHQIEVIVHFTDGTTMSMKTTGTQNISGVTISKDMTSNIILGYKVTVSITDNLDLGQPVNAYIIQIGNRNGGVNAGKSGNIFVGNGTHNITVIARFTDNSTVDVTEYLDIKSVVIGENTTLALTLNEKSEVIDPVVPEVPETPETSKVYNATFTIQDNISWKVQPTHYIIQLGDKQYEITLEPGKSATIELPEGEYAINVYAYTDGMYSDCAYGLDFTAIGVMEDTNYLIVLKSW